jgi:integrase
MKRNPNGIGSYRIRADGRAEYRVMVDGRMRYVTAPDMRTLKAKIKAGKKRPTGDTLDAWAGKWLESVQVLRSDATYDQYATMYKKHIAPHIGSLRIDAIKRSDVQAVIHRAYQSGLSVWTMRHIRKVLHVTMQEAVKDGLLQANPVTAIEIPKRQGKQRKTLTIDEVDKLAIAMERSRWRHAIQLMLCTGIRRGELLTLTWDDIDLVGRKMIIKGGDTGTKSREARTIPLSNGAVSAIRSQESISAEYRDWCPLVFPDRWGKPLDPHVLTNTLKRFAAKAGIRATPHMLRHSFVYLTREYLTLKELQTILGHAKSTTTLDMYGDMVVLTDATGDKIDEAIADEKARRLRIV